MRRHGAWLRPIPLRRLRARPAERGDRLRGLAGHRLPVPLGHLRRLGRWLGRHRAAGRAAGHADRATFKNEDELYFELQDTVASLVITARNFEEVSEQVRRGEGTLGRLVADDALYDQAESALGGVRRATQGIEDQAPISVLGTLLGTIF